MTKDFTFEIYKNLLETINKSKYKIQTLEEFIKFPEKRVTILRHDVDRTPGNALIMAEFETSMKIVSSYYFRIVAASFKTEIIKKIIDSGHEIGYHYENLCDTNGDFEAGIKDFEKNLAEFRNYYPVKTIAMHGRPTSKWDSRLLWQKYNYKKFGIIAEPYFDIDFHEVLYLTDAGRSWNNENINLRDKVESNFNFKFTSTFEIINAMEADELPDKIMINIHPEHWSSSISEWYFTFIKRKVRNSIKRLILR